MKPRLKTVSVKGYTSIRDAKVELGDLNVLVGANGSGKSNLIGALGLLGRIVGQQLQSTVVRQGGASQLLHYPGARQIELSVTSDSNDYRAVLVPTPNDEFVFDGEYTTYHSFTGAESNHRIGAGHRETVLHQRAASKAPRRSVERYVIKLLSGCRVYHFHDTSPTAPVKQPGPTADNLALQPDAANLAAVLRVLQNQSPAIYQQIVEAVRLAAPFFGGFVLEPEGSRDTVRLRWRHVDHDRVFSAHQLSDGTLRFVSLAVLLLDVKRLPEVVVLDEPELGLHPFAIVQLAEMLRAASTRSQVVVATQSVTLIDQVDLGDLIVVERRNGASTFARPRPDELREWLDEYSVGELWQKALIGGRPTRETS